MGAGAKTDWDLGQRLLDREACTLDQLREAISVNDRLGQPIDEVLLELGYVTIEQLQEERRRLGMDAKSYTPPKLRSATMDTARSVSPAAT